MVKNGYWTYVKDPYILSFYCVEKGGRDEDLSHMLINRKKDIFLQHTFYFNSDFNIFIPPKKGPMEA